MILVHILSVFWRKYPGFRQKMLGDYFNIQGMYSYTTLSYFVI